MRTRTPGKRIFGFHSSRLPEGRGGAPVNWSLIHGASDIWLSFFHYTPKVDAGAVVAQRSIPVESRDDVGTIFDTLAVAARDILDEVRPSLELDSVDATPQDMSAATYRPRRQPQDGLIDWTRSPSAQFDWVRAQTQPYPGAYTFYDGDRLRIWEGECVRVDNADGRSGEVLSITDKGGIDVVSGDGVFRIERLQLDRAPAQWADVYAVESGLTVGSRFGRHHAPPDWTYTGIRGPDGGLSFDTNLEVGEVGGMTLLCHVSERRDLEVSVTFDNKTLLEEAVTLDDTYEETVTYVGSTPGTYMIEVTYAVDNTQTDTRYLKVFVHE
ncbi:methionyl-tRNA formyltransferase [Haloplanus sp. GCM10025708]|uniref:methionyl-tRNA formyltransferase n=1 Tax=Haloplanus sp. GCM10025708 TaxID=3252679 RepID=UPI00361C9B3F